MSVINSRQIEVFDKKVVRCVNCASQKIIPWKKKEKDNITFDISKCMDCGTGFINPRPAIEWLSSIYEKSGHGLKEPISYEKVLSNEKEYPNSTVDAKRLVGNAVELLPQNNARKALDIGSGYGFYSAAALQHGFEVTAVNPGKWENDVFERMNGFRPVESLFEKSNLYGQSELFDLVIMSQVLEHVYDPSQFLCHIKKLLKMQGIIALAIPNFESIRVKLRGVRDNSCIWVPEHLNYFTINGLLNLLEQADLTIVKHHTVSRIPYFTISNYLNLKGFLRSVSNTIVKYVQKLPLYICDISGIGFYLNLWARK